LVALPLPSERLAYASRHFMKVVVVPAPAGWEPPTSPHSPPKLVPLTDYMVPLPLLKFGSGSGGYPCVLQLQIHKHLLAATAVAVTPKPPKPPPDTVVQQVVQQVVREEPVKPDPPPVEPKLWYEALDDTQQDSLGAILQRIHNALWIRCQPAPEIIKDKLVAEVTELLKRPQAVATTRHCKELWEDVDRLLALCDVMRENRWLRDGAEIAFRTHPQLEYIVEQQPQIDGDLHTSTSLFAPDTARFRVEAGVLDYLHNVGRFALRGANDNFVALQRAVPPAELTFSCDDRRSDASVRTVFAVKLAVQGQRGSVVRLTARCCGVNIGKEVAMFVNSRRLFARPNGPEHEFLITSYNSLAAPLPPPVIQPHRPEVIPPLPRKSARTVIVSGAQGWRTASRPPTHDFDGPDDAGELTPREKGGRRTTSLATLDGSRTPRPGGLKLPKNGVSVGGRSPSTTTFERPSPSSSSPRRSTRRALVCQHDGCERAFHRQEEEALGEHMEHCLFAFPASRLFVDVGEEPRRPIDASLNGRFVKRAAAKRRRSSSKSKKQKHRLPWPFRSGTKAESEPSADEDPNMGDIVYDHEDGSYTLELRGSRWVFVRKADREELASSTPDMLGRQPYQIENWDLSRDRPGETPSRRSVKNCKIEVQCLDEEARKRFGYEVRMRTE